VKEALITSSGYKTHGRHVALGGIYGSTIGVIFMGTPHRGSAKASYGDVAASIARLAFHQPNKPLLQTLKIDSHLLEKQRDNFTTVSNDLAIVCIREELPTGVGLVRWHSFLSQRTQFGY
jgi:protein SERAC1